MYVSSNISEVLKINSQFHLCLSWVTRRFLIPYVPETHITQCCEQHVACELRVEKVYYRDLLQNG